MGLGMLFAGALTGGAKAVGELADDAIKQREREEVRQQSIMDRRNELLFEMKAKADMAKQQDREEADAYVSAQGRGEQIGKDRRFAKFREDMLASGYGEGMDEEQMREYYDGSATAETTESSRIADALRAARESGAPGATIKALDAEHKGILQAERQAKLDADREAREERRRQETAERDRERYAQQERLLDKRLGAQAARGGGGSGASDKPIRFDDAQKAELAPLKRDMEKAADEAAKARPSQRAAAEARAQAARDAYDNKVVEFGGERQKPVAQKSTVKDNPTTASARPVEVKTKAAYDALPKGAKYVAPDGTVRTKG